MTTTTQKAASQPKEPHNSPRHRGHNRQRCARAGKPELQKSPTGEPGTEAPGYTAWIPRAARLPPAVPFAPSRDNRWLQKTTRQNQRPGLPQTSALTPADCRLRLAWSL